MTLDQSNMVARALDILFQVRDECDESDRAVVQRLDIATWKLCDLLEIERERYQNDHKHVVV